MEDIDSSPLAPISPNLKKRVASHYHNHDDNENTKLLNLKGTQFIMPTPPDTEGSSNASPDDKSKDGRAVSPAPSSISTLSSIVVSTPAQPQNKASDTVRPPPLKKRKLSPSEVLDKQREKETKAREREEKLKQKAEEKAKRDEEKAERDEEKRRRAEEREGKRREKELEEERKAQEKLKKERSQMRLGAFFQRPDTPAKSPITRDDGSGAFARRNSISFEPFDDIANGLRCSASPGKIIPMSREGIAPTSAPPAMGLPMSDYKRHFLPFVPPSYSSVALDNNILNPDDLTSSQSMFDAELQRSIAHGEKDLKTIQVHADFDRSFQPRVQRGRPIPNVRALVDCIQGTSQQPIDLTHDVMAQNPMEMLQAVSRRLLQFHQDVRPPWFGSFTKITTASKASKLSRNPFARVRTDTDYDYDSEAEWEEPEEGEDIDLDEDDEAESLGDADEMDGFLDDEEDMIKNKRKMITGDLVPTSTGLCWEDQYGKILPNNEGEKEIGNTSGMSMGILIPGFTGSTIDPFCTTYWTNHMEPPGVPILESATKTLQSLPTSCHPSRPPIQNRQNSTGANQQQLIGAAEGMKGPITSLPGTIGAKRGPKPQPKQLGGQVMEEFKEAVIGSQLRKLDLHKGLKLRYVALSRARTSTKQHS
nr:chromatin assembly factor 1 subunit rlf2 [Quercus suber]